VGAAIVVDGKVGPARQEGADIQIWRGFESAEGRVVSWLMGTAILAYSCGGARLDASDDW
jgi:hypothetical protein